MKMKVVYLAVLLLPVVANVYAGNTKRVLKDYSHYNSIISDYVAKYPSKIEGRLSESLVSFNFYKENNIYELEKPAILYFYQGQGLYTLYRKNNNQELLNHSIKKMLKAIDLDPTNAFPKLFISFLYKEKGNPDLSGKYFDSAVQSEFFQTYQEQGCLLYTKFNDDNLLIDEKNVKYFVRGYGNLSLEYPFLHYLRDVIVKSAQDENIENQRLIVKSLCPSVYENEYIIDWVEVDTILNIINGLKPYRLKPFFPKNCYEHIKEVSLPKIRQALNHPEAPPKDFELFGSVKIAWDRYSQIGDSEIIKRTKFWKDIQNIIKELNRERRRPGAGTPLTY